MDFDLDLLLNIGQPKKKISRGRIRSILKDNMDKDFVKRIIDKDKSPILKNKDGSYSTHEMAWAEVDGKYIVYPTIQRVGKKLKRYKPEKALDKALVNGEFISFETSNEADKFSTDYKKIWESQ